MLDKELAQRVRELELHTRRILSGANFGTTRSRQKGMGLDFDQLRAYQYGDDVRLIDWKSSARNQDTLYVRQFFEERNRTFVICLDVSASLFFGSQEHSKQEIAQQVAGILALATAWSKDKVGLILFSDQVEAFIPPQRGQHHVHAIVEKIFTHCPQSKKTDMAALCNYVQQHIKSKVTMLIISDFIVSDFDKELKAVSIKNNVVAITCIDQQEKTAVDVGLVWMQDPETDQIALVNTAGGAHSVLSRGLSSRLMHQKVALQNAGVDMLVLQNQQTFMHDLIYFFKKRMIY